MPSTLPNTRRLLNRLRLRQKTVNSAGYILVALAFLLGVGGIALAIEALFWLDPQTRYPLAVLAGVAALLPLLAVLLLVLVQFVRLRHPGDDDLARHVGTLDETLHDRLLNALQLARQIDTHTSAALRAEAVRRADEVAADLEPARFVDTRSLRTALHWFAGVAAAVVLLLLFAGGALSGAAFRLTHPHAEFLKPGRVILALEGPDTLHIVQGGETLLRVRANHSRPRGLRFLIDEGTGLIRTLNALPDTSDSSLYTALLENVQRDARYHAASGRLSSDTATVVMIARPRVARIALTLQPPAYTGQEPVSLPIGVGDISALPGAGVKFELEASRPLRSGRLVIEDPSGQTRQRELIVDRRNARGGFSIAEPGHWWVELTAEDGVRSDDPVRWNITALTDQHPRVEIRLPEDRALIPDQLVVPLAVVADDDYGISRMRLRYRIHSDLLGPEETDEDAFAAQELRSESLEAGRAIVRGLWPLTDLPLLPTDEVHYFVEVWDNDAITGPKRARSETRRLLFPSVEELFEITGRQEQEAGEEISRALERAEETRRKLEESLTRLKSNPDQVSWEETHALQQTLDNQDQMLQQLEEVARTLEQMKQQAESQNLLSEELLDKYKRLQELIEEIASPELRKAMDKLREAMDELDGEKMRQALEDLLANQEEMLASLDRSLSILERLQMEKRLDELAKRAEELAKRETELANRMEQADAEEARQAAHEQERIAQDLERLAQRAEESAEELAMQGSPLADSLRQLSGEAQSSEMRQDLQQAQDAMKQGQPKQAGAPSRSAQKRMEQIAGKMREMQQSFAQSGKDEVGQEMDRLFGRILLLSRRQEALRNESTTLGVASPRYRSLAARQNALLGALALLEKDVGELMRQSFFVGAPVAGDLHRARGYMERAVERYSDRRPLDVGSEQGHALAMLHMSLLRLNQAQQQMQNSGSGTGYEEMMQALEQMAQQQQTLNQGSQGMQMPMPGGMAPGEMLSQLAARQRALAEQMHRMEQQTRNQSMEEMLGTLEGLGDAMQEVAKDLEDQQITDRTRRLQQRIVQRLLDSQRSLQEREYSRERTGRIAEGTRISTPGALPQEEEDLLRERLLRALDGDYARPWRETIRDYFRALEKDRRTTPAQDSAE